jgi:hypothetical protein
MVHMPQVSSTTWHTCPFPSLFTFSLAGFTY